jgi:hypothetical protein
VSTALAEPQDITATVTSAHNPNHNTSFLNLFKVFPRPTFFHSAAVTSKGCMYIFGGVEWIEEDKEVERTNTVLKMWLVIPPLERLSWEALCNTVPQDRRLDTRKLGNFCVPKYLLASYNAQFLVGLQNNKSPSTSNAIFF